MTTQSELTGQVALISGGGRGRGQGAAEGRLLASQGAKVILADVLDEEGERTAGSIEGAEYAHLDVTSEADWDRVVADIIARHGRLDIVVNNAGIAAMGRLVNVATSDWDRTIAINQTGVFFGMRAGAKAMIEAGNGGSIVNISSIAGLEGMFGSMAYGASKWAVRGMTKIAAKELGRHGIRVNSVHPGFIETDMLDQGGLDDEGKGKLVRQVPTGRLGRPEDIANMVVFLCSAGAGYVTGQEFVVDGGVHG